MAKVYLVVWLPSLITARHALAIRQVKLSGTHLTTARFTSVPSDSGSTASNPRWLHQNSPLLVIFPLFFPPHTIMPPGLPPQPSSFSLPSSLLRPKSLHPTVA